MQLKCGGMFNNDFIANLLVSWWFSAVVASFFARTKLLNYEPVFGWVYHLGM